MSHAAVLVINFEVFSREKHLSFEVHWCSSVWKLASSSMKTTCLLCEWLHSVKATRSRALLRGIAQVREYSVPVPAPSVCWVLMWGHDSRIGGLSQWIPKAAGPIEAEMSENQLIIDCPLQSSLRMRNSKVSAHSFTKTCTDAANKLYI